MNEDRRVIRVRLEYDGTDFAGWQIQPGQRTVQGEVERALAGLTGETTRVQGAGRTDAGVHAWDQVASFETESAIAAEKFAPALNSRLPRDVCALRSEEAPRGFHARCSAVGKIYDYRLTTSRVRRPLLERYTWVLRKTLDTERMREAAAALVGRRDFVALAASRRKPGSTVRTVREVRVIDESELGPGPQWIGECEETVLRIRCVADGFLYKMVRNIVGALVQVGTGALTRETLEEAVASGRRELLPPTAPPNGLALARVLYPEDTESPGERARREERRDANGQREA